MPQVKCSKTYKVPRRAYGSERLDAELKLAGEYGLKNKHEIWRVSFTLSNIRRAARELLKLEDKDPRRLFEGNALIRRLIRTGILDEEKAKLDYVLGLKVEDLLERRLQTQVFKRGLAKSVHHARVLIRQRHIRVGKQIVDIPSFIVRLDSEKHIDFALTSPYGGGRPGRTKRKRSKAAEGGDEEAEADEEPLALLTVVHGLLVQSRYVGTGHADTNKFEWLQHQHRDTYASYMGHQTLMTYFAVAENESAARLQSRFLGRMLQPCGPPVQREDE
eukprot:jgi/Hompol1/6090/HPOL_004868-RA